MTAPGNVLFTLGAVWATGSLLGGTAVLEIGFAVRFSKDNVT